ncbi:MAG: hypothetical protein ABSE73_04230 [Planctomycetota bacterium]
MGIFLVALLVIGSLLIVVGLPIFLYHRREVLRMRGFSDKHTVKLSDRVATLEQRCDKLEERVTEAHLLLADEQRQMDRKLSALLPDAPAPESDPSPEAKRRGERQKAR